MKKGLTLEGFKDQFVYSEPSENNQGFHSILWDKEELSEQGGYRSSHNILFTPKKEGAISEAYEMYLDYVKSGRIK